MESTDSSSASQQQQQQQQQQPQLPPGFRFHPTDEELIVHYLKRKAASIPLPVTIIAEVDLYKFDPWELPGKANFGEQEWYFFSPRDRKYPNGARPNRAATSGYWKATGTDKPILSSSGITPSNNQKNTKVKVGVKKALVFYGGKPPKGIKTNWIMHEYRLIADSTNANANANTTTSRPPPQTTNNTQGSNGGKKASLRLDDWVLCRIYKKNNSNNNNSSSSSGNCTVQRSQTEREIDNNMLSVSAAAASSTLPLLNPPAAAATISCRVPQPVDPQVNQRLQQPLMSQHQHATDYSSALLDNDDNFLEGFLTKTHDSHQQEDGVHNNSVATTTLIQLGSSSSSSSAAAAAGGAGNINMMCSSPKPEQPCLVAPTFPVKSPLSSTISSTPNYWHQCDPVGGINVINPAIPPSQMILIQTQAYASSSSAVSSKSAAINNTINNGNCNPNVNCNSSSANNNTDVEDCGGPGEHSLLQTLLHHQIPRSSTSPATYRNRPFQMGSLQGDGTTPSSSSRVFGGQVAYELLSSINWRTGS